MDVDCSLEEFARVLVANGYINDDCCFVDSDVPSLLSAFDTNYVLGAPESYLDGTYSSGDLPRSLEMAHVASQSLFESCLTASLADQATRHHDIYTSKPQNSCAGFSVSHEPIPRISTSLSHTGNYCSSDDRIDTKGICHTASINIDIKEDNTMRPNDFPVSDNVLSHSVTSHLEDKVYHDNEQYITCHSTDHHGNDAPRPDYFPGSGLTTELDPPTSHPSGTKQKRKRRCKGYSKPTKSKKKKNKSTIEVESQPKAKKQKVMKGSSNQELTLKQDTNSFNENVDNLQDDSGFESGDKNIISNVPGSAVSEACESTDINSDSANISEGSKSLRRSSRTTRNTENYNLRLSSLVKRVETERRQEEPRQPRDKTKPAPLSKYRRRTANARERDRMKEINDAFDNLKSSLPSIEVDDAKSKVTKFTILKHALNYIASLRDILSLEAIPPSHDDDMSSDFSSVRPASVTSSGGEDSCSSPTSGLSATHPLTSKHASMFCISESVDHSDLNRSMDVLF